MEDLSQIVKDLVLNAGAIAVGIATAETLKGGPPSTDLKYVLQGAKSAVCFALGLDQHLILSYLRKKDHLSHNKDHARTYLQVNGIALELASFLGMKGYPSVPVASNFVYRKDTPRGLLDEMPDISHRYLAVRSGVGHFGLSGNVLRKREGVMTRPSRRGQDRGRRDGNQGSPAGPAVRLSAARHQELPGSVCHQAGQRQKGPGHRHLRPLQPHQALFADGNRARNMRSRTSSCSGPPVSARPTWCARLPT